MNKALLVNNLHIAFGDKQLQELWFLTNSFEGSFAYPNSNVEIVDRIVGMIIVAVNSMFLAVLMQEL